MLFHLATIASFDSLNSFYLNQNKLMPFTGTNYGLYLGPITLSIIIGGVNTIVHLGEQLVAR